MFVTRAFDVALDVEAACAGTVDRVVSLYKLGPDDTPRRGLFVWATNALELG
jgi:hypothetical protein